MFNIDPQVLYNWFIGIATVGVCVLVVYGIALSARIISYLIKNKDGEQ